MQEMFICNHCHSKFVTPFFRATPPDYQMQSLCPECGDEDIELAKLCPRCGEYFSRDEIDGFYFCTSCVEEICKTVGINDMMQYLHDRGQEHGFYVDYLHDADDRSRSRELTDVCKEAFQREINLGLDALTSGLTDRLREYCTDPDGIDDFLDWYHDKEANHGKS